MGKYEITQAQWRAVAGLPKVKMELPTDPSNDKGDSLPVEQVSWEEATEFCARLSKATGKAYRLPTEAEWEYTRRAGSTGDDVGNLDERTWYYKNSGGKTHPVGQKQPNAWGLYDIPGNVAEWCQDLFKPYSDREQVDPLISNQLTEGDEHRYAYLPMLFLLQSQGGPTFSGRVARDSGPWAGPLELSAAFRYGYLPTNKFAFLGFRIVCINK
jgi:formylglycine-generating enzyme required for sulfatase activity